MMTFHAYPDFFFEETNNIKSSKKRTQKSRYPYSITSGSESAAHLVEGWGRTGLFSYVPLIFLSFPLLRNTFGVCTVPLLTLRHYIGYLTLKFVQSGVNKNSFWSTIGLKVEPERWKGPGHDFHMNTPGCFFFYRMDQVCFIEEES
jgi:hypothetical protein